MRENRVKRALQAGEVQVGTWIHSLGAPEVPRVLATAGVDYINIDMEHSLLSIETVGHLCAVARDVGVTPIVRPAGHGSHALSRPLDNGAMGLLMPRVESRATAEAVVQWAKFPPVGRRGAQPPNIHMEFGVGDAGAYMTASNAETLILVQIESPEAVKNLDEILSVDGIDGATVGRGDLAAELGVTGQRSHPDVVGAVDATISACLRHGKIPGLLLSSLGEADEWIEKGVRLVTFGSEVIFMRSAASSAFSRIREVAHTHGLAAGPGK